MQINLFEVGAFPTGTADGFQIRFGLYLPGIRASDGFKVTVRVIHDDDRFDPSVATTNMDLVWSHGHPLDLWSVTMNVVPSGLGHFGSEGVYLYRFQLKWRDSAGEEQVITNWFVDPFARETDVGLLSAVTLSRSTIAFAWSDSSYRTKDLDELVVYELDVEQFNDTFDGVTARLTYLQSLGVNCLELMPVASPKLDFDWGYGPLHYFPPSERIGGPDGLSATRQRMPSKEYGGDP